MPAKFSGVEMKRDTVYRCYPEEIEIRPELNGRHEKPDVEWLVTDILKQGQLQPVQIWNDAGTPVLAFGFSRWRAISEINKRKLTPKKMFIDCTYIARCNEQQAFIRNISENRMRNPTTQIDDAYNIQRLFNWTMDEKEVAQIYFPMASTGDEIKDDVKWIQQTVNLIKLVPEAQRAVKDGRINETAAQALTKLSSAQQKEALKKEGKISAADVRGSAPKKAAKKTAPAPALDPELRRRITAVIESAEWEEYDEKISTFIEVDATLLQKLKAYIEEK